MDDRGAICQLCWLRDEGGRGVIWEPQAGTMNVDGIFSSKHFASAEGVEV